MGTYRVVEKFISINGESLKAGELSCFIRFAGCNLNCGYCDTKWANEKNVSYQTMTEQEIYGYIKDMGITNVTLTGGEPLLQDHIEELLRLLAADPVLSVEIETNGSIPLAPYINISDRIVFTMDYKSPSSGMEDHMCLENFGLLRKQDVVKFVVLDRNDLNKMKEIIEIYDLTERLTVYVSAVFGKIKPEEIVSYMTEYRLNKVRLQLQMHKYIWEPDRRGV